MLGVYELNRIELLRDVFVWAYARSCQQYVAVQQNCVRPDIFRLRHRLALSEVVAAIVRAAEAASAATVRARTPPSVPDADKAHFVALVLAEFKALHVGWDQDLGTACVPTSRRWSSKSTALVSCRLKFGGLGRDGMAPPTKILWTPAMGAVA
jgi:hypothetical protein